MSGARHHFAVLLHTVFEAFVFAVAGLPSRSQTQIAPVSLAVLAGILAASFVVPVLAERLIAGVGLASGGFGSVSLARRITSLGTSSDFDLGWR